MKKKDKKAAVASSQAEAASATPAVSHDLAEHSAFFDSLVELVPARYYLEPDEPLKNLKYLKKAERKATKAAMKAQLRQNKRAKLDPSAAKSTLELQQARALRNAPADADAAAAENGDPAQPRLMLPQGAGD